MKFAFKPVNLIILISSVLFLSSCAVMKARKELKEQLRNDMSEQQSTIKRIEKLDSARLAKFENGELDDKSNQQIRWYNDSVKNVAMKHFIEDRIILSKRIKHKALDSLVLRIIKIKEQAKGNLDNLSFIDNLLSTNTFTRLNTASVFGPGQFIIDLAENPAGADPLKLAVADMLSFVSKFPNRKLNATFVVLGYADAQQIAQGSSLDSLLRESLGKFGTWVNADLNKELSRLRAGSVTSVIKIFLGEQMKSKQMGELKVDYLPQGRGEQFPNAKIKDYKENDERRRVVLVYWSVFPEL